MKKKIVMAAAVIVSIICIISCAPGRIEDDPTAHSHDYKLTDTVEATCQEAGTNTYTCDCGDSYTETIKKKTHEYELTKEMAATDTEKGYRLFTCKNCDASFTRDLQEAGTPATGGTDPNNPNPNDATLDIPHAHDYATVEQKAPTCQEGGWIIYGCKRCEARYQIEVPAVDHKYELHIVVEPTADADGYEEFACVYCSKSFRMPIPRQYA